MSENREQWGSRFGFIMAAAGSAVGLGNVWRFPYITGKYGGGAFVVFYLAFVVIIGASIMLAEFAIGRNAKLDSVGSFKKLGGGAWAIVGWMGFFCGFVILSYYAVIAGWTLAYIFKSLMGLMEVAGQGKADVAFVSFISDPMQAVLFHIVVMGIVIGIVYKGIGGGIEKSCKVLMPALFVILVILIGRSVTLPGAVEGLKFYLLPEFSKLSAEGLLAAAGQAFFSLSLAMGIMVTYGSYISKDEYLPSAARTIVFLDTLVAILAGLVIFPAAFAFGVQPNAGPSLTFITLPAVFAKMPMGGVFSSAFFVLLFIAALTSAISLFEVTVSYAIDNLHWSRSKSAVIMGVAIAALGIPSALSQGACQINVMGMSFLDFADFITNNVVMPVGAIFIALFVGWVWTKGAKDEITHDGQHEFKLYNLWLFICRFVAPIALAVIFLNGIKPVLFK
ncbi:MAG: sodium-dependent transporter [Synergistaceae bacterium]|nr:sodium-dependent transporter [Synergistaceae bacterium]